MLPTTTARSWTKLLVGQTTESRKIGCKYLLFKFPEMKKLQLSRNCSLYTTPIACKRGRYISIVLQRLQNGSICLILLSLKPKVFVECPKIELFLPKIVLSDKQHFPDIFLLKSENRVGKYINTKLSNNIKGCIFYSSKWINPRFFVLLHWYSVCIWPGIKQFLCQCVPIYAGQWGVNIKKISTTAGRKMIIICIFA